MNSLASTASPSEFDAYAEDYENALQQGLSVSGESSDYFARHRVEWFSRRLHERGLPVPGGRGMDFGCGVGNSIPHLLQTLRLSQVVGLDISAQSLRIARSRFPSLPVEWNSPFHYASQMDRDLVYCNGVFHHIPLSDRGSAMQRIRDALAPGGILAFWENNPWNPGTRYIMRRIPFDRDAIPLSIPESKRLIAWSGLKILEVTTCFYFPKSLRRLRFLEPWLCKFPLGAQYCILAQRPCEVTST